MSVNLCHHVMTHAGTPALNRMDDVMHEHMKMTEQTREKLQTIKDLMNALNSDRIKSQAIDYSNDEEKKKLIHAARSLNGKLISEGVYSWKEKEIDALLENLTNEAKQHTTDMTHLTLLLTQNMHDSNKIVDILSKAIETHQAEHRRYTTNQIATR